jgi:hypothetical protein
MWSAGMKNNIIGPSFFEEHIVTGEKLLAMMEDTVLRHISAGTVFQLDCAPSDFSHHVLTVMNSDNLIGRGGPIP